MSDRPEIVCLCGSTRFSEAFQAANLRETLAGKIVLTIGCDMRSDAALGLPEDTKARLDELHLRKIDLADSVLMLNCDGYVGESAARELAHARSIGKKVDWWEYMPSTVAPNLDEGSTLRIFAAFLALEKAGNLPSSVPEGMYRK